MRYSTQIYSAFSVMDLSNSFKNIDAELKGPTLDVEFDTQSPRDFVEENASHVFTGDVEPKRPEFVIAQKETEVSLINLNTAEEKDDHFPKSMLDFPTVELNVSHVLIDEDGNKKMGNVVTEREIEDLKRDDYFLKSMLDLPTAGVNSSQVLINEDGNEKLDLSVSVRESDDQKKDDHFPKSMLDFPTADANASQVMINENENEKLDLLATERENEDQKKDDHFPKSILDFPTADTNASQVLINEDGNNFFDLFVTERKNEDLKKDDMLDFQTADVNASQVLIYEDGNKKLDLLVTDRENQDKKKNDLTDKSMPEDSSTEPSEKKGEEPFVKIESSNVSEEVTIANSSKELGSENPDEIDESEPVFDGTEILPGMAAIKNFVREKSAVAVSTVVRRLSGKSDDDDNNDDEKVKDENSESVCVSPKESEFQKTGWNPLNLIGISRVENKAEEQEEEEVTEESLLPIPMKGRILLYTRLGCKECKEARIFLRRKKLTYVEINIDVYPSRKLELEKFCGSSSVPRVFFNEILVGGMSEMKSLDEVGKLKDKMEYVVTEAPPYEAPLPPLSGEDDMSTFGSMDELALIVRKMKETIIVKDRFYKMRRFTSCFVGSEAVDFLSEDQYLERKDAVEFGRKLASGLFFQHVLEENIFEDGNHLYRFLDQDPIVSSQCYNIPRGIIEVKPKPVTEISLRLRFLSYAIFEAYTSEDGKHVDYRSIHGSEEFARYLRIIEELQRVDLKDMPREEKLAFFINLFNMMVIHAILVLGYPSGALERRKMLGDFKYIIGGCTYSLSAIQNGILRGNQRPPYNLTKPFGLKDKRAKVALPYPEPLIHFALVFGNRSGPPLRCFSAGEVDKELMEAARSFIRSGGLIVDLNLKVTSVTKILKWYSIDFGKNEVEVLKHAANYLEPVESEAMLELLATTQLKVVYQPYDWGMNN